MAKKPRRIMHDFEIREVSFVDRPAQEPALATIVKSADDEDEIGKAKTKTEGGQKFPASDYAYVPDPDKPSTWKLRLTSTPGGEPDPRIVGAAAAALGPGYRGNRVEIPAADRARVVARVRRAWRTANPDKEPADMPEALKLDETVKVVAEDLEKRWIDPSEGVVSFSDVLANEMRERNWHDSMANVSPLVCAMETSVRSIAGAPEVSPDQKTSMIRNQVEDFMTLIRAQFSQADEVMMAATMKGDDIVPIKKDEQTTETLKAQVDELNAKLEKATDDLAKAGELATRLEALEKENTDLKALAAEEAAKAAMTQEERAHMRGLGKEERAAFMRMSQADRKKAMAKAAGDDETFESEGITVRKSVVGEDFFAILKSQAARGDALEKSAREERDRRETTEYQKMAEDRYASLPGTTVEKGAALRVMFSSLPAEAQTTLEKMLEAGQKAIAGAFTTIGHRAASRNEYSEKADTGANGNDPRAGHPFSKRVQEIKNKRGVSGAEAMRLARMEAPAEFNEYRNLSR